MMKLTLLLLVALTATAVQADMPCPFSVSPVDMTSVRYVNGGVIMLDFTRIFPFDGPIEDRLIAEFDVTMFRGDIRSVSLMVLVDNIDHGGTAGIIQCHGYIGDGTVATNDFYLGQLCDYRVMNTEGYTYVVFDVTDHVLNNVVAHDYTYAGFRLNCYNDRYEVMSASLRCNEGTDTEQVSWGAIKLTHKM